VISRGGLAFAKITPELEKLGGTTVSSAALNLDRNLPLR
jgi:hypothetical protein